MDAPLEKKSIKISVEIADTPSKREKGLMYRKDLGQNEGMIFKYPQKQYMSFWMKNTYIPLDIAFISDDGEILQIETMAPLSTKSIKSSQECKYALEVNSGWFKSNKIKVGNKIKGLFFDNKRYAQVENKQVAQDQNVSPDVILNFSLRDKLKYAEDHGLKLKIIYISKNGHYVGPRIISPVKQENNKYPILNGPEGNYFKAYDESPTIQGNNWTVEGGRIKSYYFDGVMKIEILDKNGNPIDLIKGQNIKEPEINQEEINKKQEDLKSIEIKNYLKRSIPNFSEEEWESVKDDVIKDIKQDKKFEEIIFSIKNTLLSLIPKWKDKFKGFFTSNK